MINKYCVGFNLKPEIYTNQKEPIFIGTFEEVQEWISNFFKSLYK
jgi:hypothetical protein